MYILSKCSFEASKDVIVCTVGLQSQATGNLKLLTVVEASDQIANLFSI